MKIVMIKNIWQSGEIRLEKGKEYSSPKDISNDFAKLLVDAGKAKKKVK